MRPMMQAVKDKFGDQELIGAEIGVQRGNHARSMFRNFQIKQLVLVDIWDSEITNPHLLGDAVPASELYEIVKIKFQPFPQTILHRALSNVACKLYPNNYFDFIYIDASHAYKNVKIDCDCWYPKLKSNGIIGGHDYFYYSGCRRAVDEFVEHNNLNLNSATPDWWVVKS